MERFLPLDAVYELANGDFLYIQDTDEEEDFEYTFCDSKGNEIDGGYWGMANKPDLTHEVMCDFLTDNGYVPQYKHRPDLDIDGETIVKKSSGERL